jgi:hypothetical protein
VRLDGTASMSVQSGKSLASLIEELMEAAARCGLKVRREKLLREVGYRARGGACNLRGTDFIFVDREQPAAEQLEILSEALRARNTEDLYLSPAARRLLNGGSETL